MPLQHLQDIYASAPLRRLREQQCRALATCLQREPGRHALRIGVASDDAVPALRGVGWTRLWLDGERYAGDVRGDLGEALPFVDAAFDILWLQHALEPVQPAQALLQESSRVLADGGLLVVTQLHPCSAWAPWYRWHARGGRQTLRSPWWLRHLLRVAGLTIEQQRRVGPAWPSATGVGGADSRWGGACLLLARKRIVAPVPSWRPLPVRVPVNARLSPGTRRHAAVRSETVCDD